MGGGVEGGRIKFRLRVNPEEDLTLGSRTGGMGLHSFPTNLGFPFSLDRKRKNITNPLRETPMSHRNWTDEKFSLTSDRLPRGFSVSVEDRE